MKRDEALELLRNQHTFPGVFDFRVVVRAGKKTTVVSAIQASVGESGALQNVKQRASSKGNYEALVVQMRVTSAEQVLDVYDLIQNLPEVVTAM